MPNYYFAIASQDFLIEEEPVEEILRERTNHYLCLKKDLDFWFVLNPAFIRASSMRQVKNQLSKPSAAIISLDAKFIEWLKLRIGFVITGSFESPSKAIPNPLESLKG
uniref:Ycf54 n=1 Tax=Ahnfeltia plicata TaxID=28023 RepID=A0A1C9CB58_9FLOR|nr:hypothetical protein Ahnf_122 [Ahnfeltia plicata]AOM65607.1 hypothetical protein Ahnf_122 [Ahnfeltia plicata]UAT97251.1 hypothetical protein Ahn.pli.UK.pt_074 [Ahnfeltia plicata]UAT97456.1 hypothetical protein Ahn.pli.Chile.pt_074 [Ahnfeltia plicata]